MSLAAGLAFDKPLGGVIAISGWTHKRGEEIPVHEENKNTPVLFTCGISDPVIDFKCAEQSGAELKAKLGEHVTVNHEQRREHGPTGGEMEQVMEFMTERLASTTRN
eukprot:TRINITY_DN21404_c0_g1_i2.p2 TRINITY_DN21404_c0_g1~~TRINITY_DN21404_c0_g1_i2.p2  ORF type:complete len:107 (-),score=34.14 TRINITY_DN21404_c0_g1_i2:164-484(-)